jgi:hypothetical protein
MGTPSVKTESDIDAAIADDLGRIRAGLQRKLDELRSGLLDDAKRHVTSLEARSGQLLGRVEKAEQMLQGLEHQVQELRVAIDTLGAAEPPRATKAVLPGLESLQGTARPAPRTRTVRPASVALRAYLESRNLEVIDHRDAGGNLWVTGPEARVRPVIDELKQRGIRFTYSAAGSRATGGRPGWYTKSKA